MSGVTWRALIRLDNGDQVPVQVRASTQYDARQLIELQYGRGRILFGPSRVDLTRSPEMASGLPEHRTSVEMMSGVLLIFGLPMIVAAVLISPSALHDLVHGVLFYAILGLVLPFVGWRIFLTVFAFPSSGTGRVAAVLNLWVGGTVMVPAAINLAIAVLDYSPMRPRPNPTAGFLLAGLVLCMFVSCGVWGALAPILPRDVAIRCGRDARFSGLQVKAADGCDY